VLYSSAVVQQALHNNAAAKSLRVVQFGFLGSTASAAQLCKLSCKQSGSCCASVRLLKLPITDSLLPVLQGKLTAVQDAIKAELQALQQVQLMQPHV
jgi:hypothetical protein